MKESQDFQRKKTKEKLENKRNQKGRRPKRMKREKNYVLRKKIFTVLTQVFHSLNNNSNKFYISWNNRFYLHSILIF